MNSPPIRSVSRRQLATAAGLAAVAGVGGFWWWRQQQVMHLPESLLIAGASTMFDLNQAWLPEFKRRHPGINTVLEAGGSLAGLIALKRGAIDVAAMSRDLTAQEDSARTRSHLVAFNDVSIIVHPDAGVRNVTMAQLRGVLTGQIDNWVTLGGPPAPLRLYSRAEGSRSRRFVQDQVLQGQDIVLNAPALASAAEMARAVSADRNGIGFLAQQDRTDTPLAALAVDGVQANRATVLSGRYPLAQPLFLVLHGEASPAAQAYVDFARSAAGQAIVAQTRLFPVA